MKLFDWQRWKVLCKIVAVLILLCCTMGLIAYNIDSSELTAMYTGLTQYTARVIATHGNISNIQNAKKVSTKHSTAPFIVFNPHERNDFSLLINNPDICVNNSQLQYVVYVHSAVNHFKQRHVLRTTWLSESFLEPRGISRVFLLGRHDGDDSREVQDLVLAENDVYGDIVQGDYHDTYQNISLKALMGMKWLSTYCSEAKLVIKFDDDVVVDFVKLLDLLSKYEGHKKTFICQVFRGNPILRNPKTCMRWCLDPSVLPKYKAYPTHCSGPVFSMTPDLPPLLYETARSAPFVWVDDAYLTGVLPEKINGIHFQKNVHVWSHGKNSAKVLSAWGDYWKKLLSKSNNYNRSRTN